MKIIDFFCEDDCSHIWAYVENEGRGCYWGVEVDKIPGFDSGKFYDGSNAGIEAIMPVLLESGFDPAKLPHIEDADPVMQQLWRNITESDNNMWFIDEPAYSGDEEEDTVWAYDFGITREEYERRVDAAIRKYELQDVITKYEDGYSLYTCYGDLQSSFSEERRARLAQATMDKVAAIFGVCVNRPFRVKHLSIGREVTAQFRNDGLYLFSNAFGEWTKNHTWLADLLAERVVRV